MSAGDGHTCGIAIDGDAYCWGGNGHGQLGDGSLNNRSTPVQVAGGLVWRTVSAGVDNTCGVTIEGNAYCWGNNAQGQLGNGSNIDSDTPSLVSGGLFFTSISVGGVGVPPRPFTCGITTGGGSVYCWGSGTPGITDQDTTVPVAVNGELTSVTAGGAHICGVPIDHTLYCGGANFYGQLGDGVAAF